MKKLIAAVCALLAATVLLCACSQSKVKPLSQVYSSIKEKVELSELDDFNFVSAHTSRRFSKNADRKNTTRRRIPILSRLK